MNIYNSINPNDVVSNQIMMVPSEFVRDIVIAWDVRFVDSNEFIGVVEEYLDGYMFTNSFKHQITCDDREDLREIFIEQFVPQKHQIN